MCERNTIKRAWTATAHFAFLLSSTFCFKTGYLGQNVGEKKYARYKDEVPISMRVDF